MAKARYYRRVPHAPEKLLDMVADVENYPKFVDLITHMRVIERIEVAPHHDRFEAEAVVAYKMINETFGSVVDVYRDAGKIVVTKSDRAGALKALINEWTFHPLGDGSTLVEFYIDVKLKAFFLEGMVSQKFESASTTIMDAFESRADELYPREIEADYDLSADLQRIGVTEDLLV